MVTTASLFGGVIAAYVFATAITNEYTKQENQKQIRRDNIRRRRRSRRS